MLHEHVCVSMCIKLCWIQVYWEIISVIAVYECPNIESWCVPLWIVDGLLNEAMLNLMETIRIALNAITIQQIAAHTCILPWQFNSAAVSCTQFCGIQFKNIYNWVLWFKLSKFYDMICLYQYFVKYCDYRQAKGYFCSLNGIYCLLFTEILEFPPMTPYKN